MRNFKTILAVGMMAVGSINAMAQDSQADEAAYEKGYYSHPYWFVQAQAGGATTFTNGKNFMDLVTPTFSLGFGRMFTPVVGARIHVNGGQQKGLLHVNGLAYDAEGFVKYNENGTYQIQTNEYNYKYNYINSNIDVMINLSNIFTHNYFKPLNVYLIGGVGLNYAWKNDEFTDLVNTYGANIQEDVSNAWGNGTSRKSLLDHSIRAGLLLDYNVCKNFSVGAEVDINNLSDRFNSKYNDADDWMLTAQLSLTYKFGFKKAEKPVVAPVTTTADYDRAAAEAEAARAAAKKAQAEELARAEAAKKAAEAAKKVVEEPLKETAYFQIRESDPNGDAVLDKVVSWCNKYPSKSITISGYADKGTGNPKINMKYSKQRADKVAKALQAKGISADRMTVNAYGDTVQPYTNNDDNRCTIVVGK